MEQKLTEAKIPNFFIVGAAKSGTTSVYQYLSQHPEIYLSPIKEPQFFSDKAHNPPHKGPGDDEYDWRRIKTWEDYTKLFKGAENEKIIGEASTSYLYYYKTAAPLIYKLNPNAKILIMLRNPAERAFSAYRHMIRDKRETLSFEDALKSEEYRRKENYAGLWFYTEIGFYHLQVMEYLNIFNKNVKICLFDDFNNNPGQVIEDILKFLEVDEDFNLDVSIKHNTSQINIFGLLNDFLNNDEHPVKKLLRPVLFNTLGEEKTGEIVNFVRGKTSVRMKPETRRYLTDLYRDDILRLQDLIDRDLSRWL